MRICPACRGEFLDHIKQCAHCQVVLVDEHELEASPRADELLSKNFLLQEETIAVIEGGIDHCREIEKILTKCKIPCAVYPVDLKSQANPATLGSSCSMKYVVLVKADDDEHVKIALEDHFHAQVAKEGTGEYVKTAVNLDDDVITCPACGESGRLDDGECVACGLFLGTIE